MRRQNDRNDAPSANLPSTQSFVWLVKPSRMTTAYPVYFRARRHSRTQEINVSSIQVPKSAQVKKSFSRNMKYRFRYCIRAGVAPLLAVSLEQRFLASKHVYLQWHIASSLSSMCDQMGFLLCRHCSLPALWLDFSCIRLPLETYSVQIYHKCRRNMLEDTIKFGIIFV